MPPVTPEEMHQLLLWGLKLLLLAGAAWGVPL